MQRWEVGDNVPKSLCKQHVQRPRDASKPDVGWWLGIMSQEVGDDVGEAERGRVVLGLSWVMGKFGRHWRFYIGEWTDLVYLFKGHFAALWRTDFRAVPRWRQGVTSWKAAAVTQLRDDGGSDWDGSRGGRKSGSGLGTFQRQKAWFEFVVGIKKKEESKIISKPLMDGGTFCW